MGEPQGSIAIIHILLSCMFGLMLGVGLFILTYKRIKRALLSTRKALLVANVQLILDRALIRTNADRALIFSVSNNSSTEYEFASVIIEGFTNKHAIKDDFQAFSIDPAYKKILLELRTYKMLQLEPSDMEQGMLLRRYQYEDINAAILVYLLETDTKLYYADFSTTREALPFLGGDDYVIIESKANRLRNLYNLADKLNLLF